MNFYFITIDGETSYLSPKCYNFLRALEGWESVDDQLSSFSTTTCIQPTQRMEIELIPLNRPRSKKVNNITINKQSSW